MGVFSFRKSKKCDSRVESAWVKREVFDGRPYYFNTSKYADLNTLVSSTKPLELMTPDERASRGGEWVWAPHPTDCWQVAKVVHRGCNGAATVQPVKGEAIQVPEGGVIAPCSTTGGRTQKVPLWDVSWSSMDWVEDDIIQLDGIHEASILHNLRTRYLQGSIYTWVGANRSVLLSVNPYESLPELYAGKAKQLHKTLENKPDQFVPPHVFTVINEAYDTMRNSKRDQSILVSGESGAGKTEATKYSLEFLADMIGSDTVEHHIADNLLLSNPLLEAFGNSVTLRNNNSSRFSKFIKVNFSRSSGKITGASFINFMLEKTRVVSHQEQERSFHIFYMLLQDASEKSRLGLRAPADYAYLNQSGTSLAPNADDKPGFALVQEALADMGFSPVEVDSVFSILAGVLAAGNLTFANEEQSSGVTGSRVLDNQWLEAAADAWSMDIEVLREACVSRTLTARGESSTVVQDARAAKDAVDALCKTVYSTLFQCLVKRVNDSMVPAHSDYFIGLLDIFGFETLTINGFEQLCINYCNEKLQQYHNQHTFDSEEAFYSSQGVEYHFLQPHDNQDVLDLLEKRPHGILFMLDDEGNLPGGSEQGWLNKVEKQYKGNALLGADFRQKFESGLSFQIQHFACGVRYNASGFIAKNKDTKWASGFAALGTSKDSMLSTMFNTGIKMMSNTKPVGQQFRANVTSLLDLVKGTDVRFIRCIKSNALMRAKDFDASLVVEQLTKSGVFETVELRKEGFPFRLTYKQFFFRYGCVNLKHRYNASAIAKGNWRNLATETLNTNLTLQELSDNVRLGETMILYRANVHKPLVTMRNISIEFMVPEVQAFIRGAMARHYCKQLRKAQSTLTDALITANDMALVRKGFAEAEAVWEWLELCLSFLPAYPMHLYDKAKHLESRLVAFETFETELSAVVAGKQPADVDAALYKLLITLCDRADSELDDIKRTEAQVELYERCRKLIIDSPPSRLNVEAEHALKLLDRTRMQAAKDESDRLGYPTETIEKIAIVLDHMVHIDAESETAIDVLDGARMKAVLDEASLYNHTNAALKEIERLFTTDEEEFVELELIAARRVGDKVREIHRRIRLREIHYEKEGHRYEATWESGHARPDMLFAKSAGLMLCGRTEIARGMHHWTAKALPAPLSIMPGEVVSSAGDQPDTKEVKRLKQLCKKQFTNLQKYMGDRKADDKAAEKAGQAVVQFGFEHSELRNELFLQMTKQLTQNPKPKSIDKGYEILALAMSQFLPSGGFEDYLVMWIRNNPGPSGDFRPYTSALHKLQFGDATATKQPKPLVQLRKDFKMFTEEGSRFSIEAGAFTGPSNVGAMLKLKNANASAPQEEEHIQIQGEHQKTPDHM